MDDRNEKKHPHKPDPDDMPNYSLPIDEEVFKRLFHEVYAEVTAEFANEEELKRKITEEMKDVMNDVLHNHVSKITRRHLNRE